MAKPSKQENHTVRVWDPWVRISHWVLAGSFVGAYFLTEELLGVHVWLGYLIGALLLVRFVWGAVGPGYARFSDFVPSPRRLADYAGKLWRGKAPRYLGHNPLGGAMIIALLLALAGTVGTGLMVLGAEENAGPLRGWYASSELERGSPVSTFRAEPEEEEAAEHEEAEMLEESHEFFANLTMALVGLHILGVLVSSAIHRENLARAMVTGRKRAPESGGRA